MKIAGIIPARYASTRFPGKPLADIGGITMIERVYRQAQKATRLNDVLVATDDERIYNHVKSFGGKVVLTSAKHLNGTERCAEAAQHTDADVIINIQGDEPFINPGHIDELCACFNNPETQIATLITPHVFDAGLAEHSRIKVVVNHRLQALYFSRQVIPYRPQPEIGLYYKHIGIYGFKLTVLQQVVALPPTELEQAESLEQLRWLQNGYPIQCAAVVGESLSVDTPDDLLAVQKFV